MGTYRVATSADGCSTTTDRAAASPALPVADLLAHWPQGNDESAGGKPDEPPADFCAPHGDGWRTIKSIPCLPPRAANPPGPSLTTANTACPARGRRPTGACVCPRVSALGRHRRVARRRGPLAAWHQGYRAALASSRPAMRPRVFCTPAAQSLLPGLSPRLAGAGASPGRTPSARLPVPT